MTDLTKAIAELQRISVSKTEHLLAPHDEPFATILNAALSGDLIPRADAELAELATLRAQVERLTGAADRLRKMHQMSLRTADYHNINCQCPRCIDDEIVAALTAYEHGRAARKQGNRK